MIRVKWPLLLSVTGALFLFVFHWAVGVLFFLAAAIHVWAQDRFTWK